MAGQMEGFLVCITLEQTFSFLPLLLWVEFAAPSK